jgi:hypothetical protein
MTSAEVMQATVNGFAFAVSWWLLTWGATVLVNWLMRVAFQPGKKGQIDAGPE